MPKSADCNYLKFKRGTHRLRTVDSNSDADGAIVSDGVVTYVKRGSDTKKATAEAVAFCSALNLD